VSFFEIWLKEKGDVTLLKVALTHLVSELRKECPR
jgi:hypothetical protein